MTAAVSHWASHGPVSLRYLEVRHRGSGPEVLIVPGFGEDADDYADLLAAVAPRRAVAVDLRGRGRSTAAPSGYRIEDHFADLEAIATKADLGPVHLVTYSRGTAYGLGWAFAGPGRVASITIGDYPPAQLVPPPNLPELVATRRWRGRAMTDRMTPAAVAAMVEDAVAVDWWEQLSTADVPVMVVRAGAGGMIDERTATAYRNRIPRLRMETFADSGHDLWSPDPHRFAATVAAFLDEVET